MGAPPSLRVSVRTLAFVRSLEMQSQEFPDEHHNFFGARVHSRLHHGIVHQLVDVHSCVLRHGRGPMGQPEEDMDVTVVVCTSSHQTQRQTAPCSSDRNHPPVCLSNSTYIYILVSRIKAHAVLQDDRENLRAARYLTASSASISCLFPRGSSRSRPTPASPPSPLYPSQPSSSPNPHVLAPSLQSHMYFY